MGGGTPVTFKGGNEPISDRLFSGLTSLLKGKEPLLGSGDKSELQGVTLAMDN